MRSRPGAPSSWLPGTRSARHVHVGSMEVWHVCTRRPERPFARLDETPNGWKVEPSLRDSTAQCLALDPNDPDTVYVGLGAGGVRKTTDGGAHVDRPRPRRAAGLLRRRQRCGWRRLRGHRTERALPQRRRGGTWRELTGLLELPSRPTWSFPPRPWTSHVRWIAPSPHAADTDPRRHRARWADAVDRRRRDVARPPAGRAARRAFARVASARAWARVRSRRRGSRLE